MLDQNDLNVMQHAIMAAVNASGRVGGREAAFTPSTGDQVVEPGNRDQFWYSYNVTNIAAAGGVNNGNIAISADSNFYCNALSYFALNHASLTGITEATNVIPLVTLLITDTGSSRQLMQQPVPLSTIAGDGKHPYRLTRPRLFQRTTTINLSWVNFDSALAYDIYFVLHGFKVYSNSSN